MNNIEFPSVGHEHRVPRRGSLPWASIKAYRPSTMPSKLSSTDTPGSSPYSRIRLTPTGRCSLDRLSVRRLAREKWLRRRRSGNGAIGPNAEPPNIHRASLSLSLANVPLRPFPCLACTAVSERLGTSDTWMYVSDKKQQQQMAGPES